MTIPQVKERETEIKLVADNPDYLDGASLEKLERIRMTLRDLIRFIADSTARKMVITDLKDLSSTIGRTGIRHSRALRRLQAEAQPIHQRAQQR